MIDYLNSIVWTLDLILEVSAVAFGLAYIIAIAYEKPIGWLFGIVNSILSVWLFYRINYKAESILYLYYVVMGAYGWITWNKGDKQADKSGELKVTEWPFKTHLLYIGGGLLGTFLLGKLMQWFSSDMPYLDAASTVFSFIATWLAARKVLSNWLYWIIIDLFGVWFYHYKSLDVYAGLMLLYTVLAVWGWYSWRKENAVELNVSN